ncbi:MAG: hypothetical protein RJA99_275 [Pseudomonadota bacterium]|jgi:AcrR family transcriptional regulator
MTTPAASAPRPAAARDPEGAHPVKQDRSRVLRDKALDHARALVEAGRFDDTTMADFAGAVGCSVGALYFRFHDKDGLFASAVDVALAQELEALRGRAAKGRYRGLPLRETVDRCVQDYVAFVRRNDSMIRALYRRASGSSEHWTVVQSSVYRMVRVWTEAVADAAGRPGDREYLLQVGVAFQFVSNSLVYSLLIDKPVRPLSPRALVFWLDEMVMHFIGLEVPDAMRRIPVVRPAATPAVGPARAEKPDRTAAPARTAAPRPRARKGARA